MVVDQIILKSRPVGMAKLSDFEFSKMELPPLCAGEVLIEPLFYSVDPYMRPRMSGRKSYVAAYVVGEAISGSVVGRVVESLDSRFAIGTYAMGMGAWATATIVAADTLTAVSASEGIPLSYYLGILGKPGLSAYFGLLDICQPKSGETVVVSGAAGAVGMVVGQLAKMRGCYVIGIAGTDEKCQLLVDKYGYNKVINYRSTPDIKMAVREAAPRRVDCYFDNVGGDITDGVLANINFGARIALCGQISLYNIETAPVGKRVLSYILTYSATMRGFIVGNYQDRFLDASSDLSKWLLEGKLSYEETIVRGFDQLPQAFIDLFSGKNIGKMVVER